MRNTVFVPHLNLVYFIASRACCPANELFPWFAHGYVHR
jgi:hypothetical protein